MVHFPSTLQSFHSSDSSGSALLRERIVEFAEPHVATGVSAESCFLFSPDMTCRQRCSLTTSADRGCVYFSAEVLTSITCTYTNEQLR